MDPEPCNSSILGINEDPNRITIIPYSHDDWVGFRLGVAASIYFSSGALQLRRDYTLYEFPKRLSQILMPPGSYQVQPVGWNIEIGRVML